MTPFNYGVPYDNTQVTVELRHLVESGIKVWDFDYPSYYKGEQKKTFEQKVLDHFWCRQIGMETPGRWLHYFRTRIREIMPYYIQLYESEALMRAIDDPFGNVDIVETFEQESSGESSGTSRTENTGNSSGSESEDRKTIENHERKFSNTPQGSIENLDNYLTEANVETADDGELLDKYHEASTSATSEGVSSGTESAQVKHTLTRKGNQGVNTYAHDMNELRQTFLNIDLYIINELNDLFLMVY